MNNTLLDYRMFGKGHPVIFLHGFLESKSMWSFLDLEKFNFQSILIDLPGHGSSKNEDDNEPSIEFMANKVSDLMNHLSIKSFSIVGHSMGGYVALVLKNMFSNRDLKGLPQCEKVILLNSNFWGDSDLKKNDRLRIAEIVSKNKNLFIKEAIPNLFVSKENNKSEISQLIAEAALMDKHAIIYATLAMRNRSSQVAVLKKFPKDFTIIQGVMDTIIPVELMNENIKDLPVQTFRLVGVGHMAHIESTFEVKEIISNLLV
jgi:pimeloyl-ACP methyl ester carboxylesterase